MRKFLAALLVLTMCGCAVQAQEPAPTVTPEGGPPMTATPAPTALLLDTPMPTATPEPPVATATSVPYPVTTVVPTMIPLPTFATKALWDGGALQGQGLALAVTLYGQAGPSIVLLVTIRNDTLMDTVVYPSGWLLETCGERQALTWDGGADGLLLPPGASRSVMLQSNFLAVPPNLTLEVAFNNHIVYVPLRGD
jgi:hypothetical protein